jgi:hypothetical protein
MLGVTLGFRKKEAHSLRLFEQLLRALGGVQDGGLFCHVHAEIDENWQGEEMSRMMAEREIAI